MKYLQRLFFLSVISFIIFSCQKEYSVENGGVFTTTNAQWEFKEGGVQFKGPIDTAGIDTLGGFAFLTVNGHSDDGASQVTLQVFGAQIKTGTYKTPFSLFAYIKAGSVVYQTDQQAADSFSIVISKLDTTGVSGTFSGRVLLANGTTASKVVDGKFSAVFKKAVVTPPASTDSGQVVLWSKVGCGGGTSTSPITVSVGTRSGQIMQFTPTEPTTCDPAGSFSAKLPVGTYTVKAKCGNDSISTSVTVVKNTCTKIQIDLTKPLTGDYFPITKNSDWSYNFEGYSDTLYTFSTGNTKTLSAPTPQVYNIFTNTDGQSKDSSYYRKANGIYYEYTIADTIGTAVEHIFLKDNVAAGNTWKTTSPGGTLGGLPFTVEVRDTLTAKLTSLSVNGKLYPDVLEVHTGYFLVFGAPIGAQQAYLVKQWFAKGVGLVKFYQNDYVTGTGEYTQNLKQARIY